MTDFREQLFPNNKINSILPFLIFLLINRILLTNEYFQKLIGLNLANFKGGLINNEYFKLSIADLTIPLSISILTYIFLKRLNINLLLSILFIISSYFLVNLILMYFTSGNIDEYNLEIAFFNSTSLLLFFGLLYRLTKLKWVNFVSFGIILHLSDRLCGLILYELPYIFSSNEFSYNPTSLIFDLTKFIEGIIAAAIYRLIYYKLKT